ncbi:hypothetical protein [Streptomyces sp. UNOC14_S4]|uniref:hypothetical protein n=1 Tax=Streptomyces sp. UNOC14_S4 TaxID=2872340 RepID=UPI001E42CB38|nr:hypothetical protein [Streptomyces sp. UNOC14_S4]MCC3766461.1 hypothetical protein [Streptomyces sp. UNOC14_S4]
MLAVSERVSEFGGPDRVILHLPAVDDECDECVGDCVFHAIACSSEYGIVLPSPMCDVPLDLDHSHGWCVDCLAVIAAAAGS